MPSNDTSLTDPNTAAETINAALETRDPERIANAVNQVLTAHKQTSMKLSGWMVSEALNFLGKLGLRVTVEPASR